MYDVFLSYSTQDRERLMPLMDLLERHGWSVFWDHRSIPVGGDWHDLIGDAIQECRCVVVAWSAYSVESRWVREEALEGAARKVLLPILLDEVPQPFGFKIIQSANFAAWDGKATHPEFVKLDNNIRRLLGQPSTASTTAAPSTPLPVASSQPHASRRLLWATGSLVAFTIVGAILGIQYLQATTSPQQAVTPAPIAVKTQIIEPDMLAIPAGTAIIGCQTGRDDVEGGCYEDEKPIREANLRAFQVSRDEITVAQYLACVDASACPKPRWQEPNALPIYTTLGETIRGKDRPIVGVSWNDAQKYVQWLSKVSRKSYRLLTEQEWEYAARAGTTTAFPWGNSITASDANCAQHVCGDPFPKSAPVGSFAANPFGLHDMNGNVWEWVQDSADGGKTRVVRGGSWANAPRALRSASRHQHPPQHQHYLVGFRIASGG